MKSLKTSEDVINYLYYNAVIITKDRGNRGFFIKHDSFDHNLKTIYEYVPKSYIINFLTCGIIDERKRKLITLQIMSE